MKASFEIVKMAFSVIILATWSAFFEPFIVSQTGEKPQFFEYIIYYGVMLVIALVVAMLVVNRIKESAVAENGNKV